MRHFSITAALGLAVLAGTSQAFELTWVDGSKDITVTSTALCTLLVRPSPPLDVLPAEWRLVYVGTSAADSAIVFLNSPGPADATPPCAVEEASTDADREAHLTTIAFCSPDGEPTRAAAFILRVDPSLQALIAAVASSSRSPGATATLSSDAEVAVNGGCALPYPPVVWAANQSLDAGGCLQLVFEGIGLDHVKSVASRRGEGAAASPPRPGGPSGAATDTLSITSQTSRSLAAALASPLPLGGTVILSCAVDSVAAAVTVTQQQLPSKLSGVPTMFPPYPYRPKEFAFIYAQGLFHLFYIRHAINAVNDDSTEIDFGHAVSQDLMTWTQRDPILHVRSGNWDDVHVWSPSVIWQHGIYYLFYTGVSNVPYPNSWYQRIGVATSDDLENWTRYDTPVFSGNQAPWVLADSSRFEGCQFRDPFVMEDPGQTDHWLMYYCAAPKAAPSQLISGIARNATGLSAWQDLKPLWNTDAAHYQGYTESPDVFSHAGRWYLFFTTNSGHPIRFQHSASPTADSTGWLGTWRLFDNEPGTDAWFAPEFLRVGSHEYFGAVNSANNGIEIREMTWTGVTRFTLSTPSVTAVPGETEEAQGALSVLPLGNGQGGSVIRFRVDLPSTMEAELSIYDVVGRRIRTLHDGSLPGGRSTIAWDRKDYAGRELGAGIYIVRLETAMGSRSAKAAVLP